MHLREAPWTAVAAATAFGLRFIRQRRKGRRKKGGSCCYRTPRRFARVHMKTCAKCTARQSRNQSRAMAVPAMLEHGRDARGTKSSRVTKNLGISSTEITENRRGQKPWVSKLSNRNFYQSGQKCFSLWPLCALW